MLSSVELKGKVQALGADLVGVVGVRGGHQRASRPAVKSHAGRFGRDLILVMEKFHLKFVKMKSFLNSVSTRLLTEYDPDKEPYDVPDPLGEPIETYEASARIIDNCVKGVHAYLDTIFRNE